MDVWGKSIPSGGNCRFKGPEAGGRENDLRSERLWELSHGRPQAPRRKACRFYFESGVGGGSHWRVLNREGIETC